MLKAELVPNKDFFDSYKEAILIASATPEVIYVNAAFTQLTGLMLDAGDEKALMEILKACETATVNSNESHCHLSIGEKNAQVKPVNVSSSPLILSDLTKVTLFTFTRPGNNPASINDERKFYELADASPAMIFLEDKNGQAFFFNKAWLEFIGDSGDNRSDSKWETYIHPEDIKVTEEHRAEDVDRVPYSYELRLQKFDGSYRNIFVIRTPVTAEDGTFNGYMASCLDITEIEESQNKINELTRELKLANEELEQFTYVTSHDLQEPLRMITGYIQLIQKNIERGNLSAIQEFMDFVLSGTSRMQMLIADLLKLSRVNRKGAPFTSVDLSEVLNVALAHLAKKIKNTGAEINCEQLPVVTGDTFQLVNLFENILDNALKFTPLDTSPHIAISVTEADGKYIFEVKDNGIGIDNKFHKRIFAIFQRLHNRGEYEGTGIGLAVCKKIVERHGGDIWVQSEPGNGSAFYFSIKK